MFGKSKKIKIVSMCAVMALIAVVFAGAASVGGEEEPVQEVKRDILVDTVSPEIGDIVVTGEYIGTMEPNQQVAIYPKVAAEVLAVNFNVGDVVQAGDVLFELDSKILQTSIAQSQAALNSAKAKARLNLAITENNLDTQEYNVEYGHDNTLKGASNAIDSAKDAVAAAENRMSAAIASHTSARRQLREFRDDEIWPPSLASMQTIIDYDQAEDQLKDAVRQAELAVEAAELGVEQAKNGLAKAQDAYETAKVMTEEQYISINNQVAMAKLNTNFSDQDIAIQKLMDDLGNYTVKAPINGVIESRAVEPYNMASPQAPAFVISDKDSMTVSFKISQAAYAHMKLGDSVTLEKNGANYTGTVIEISTMVDQSGMFTVKANIQNPPDDLYTGASVKIYADAQKVTNAVVIPLSALYYDNGAPYVYIAENGFAKKVPVEVGIYDSENIEIISGVSMSDRIIGTWSSNLADGVEIVLAPGAGTVETGEGTDK